MKIIKENQQELAAIRNVVTAHLVKDGLDPKERNRINGKFKEDKNLGRDNK